MKSAAFLGVAWSYMAVLADVLYETFGVRDFHVYKNMPIEGSPRLDFNPHKYAFTVYEPGTYASIPQTLRVFGVCWPKAKYFVAKDFEKYLDYPKELSNCIHPTAYVAGTVQYGAGLLVEPEVIISSQTTLGKGITLKRACSIGHHNKIGDFTDLDPGVTTASHVTIGKGCIISTEVVIRNGVSIGDNTYIGMGSVVTKDIPAGVVAYGNPCQVIRENLNWRI
jgi:UDP-3-O-[3-hydroxymyristoyl] glucosamine N-acyltransferase